MCWSRTPTSPGTRTELPRSLDGHEFNRSEAHVLNDAGIILGAVYDTGGFWDPQPDMRLVYWQQYNGAWQVYPAVDPDLPNYGSRFLRMNDLGQATACSQLDPFRRSFFLDLGTNPVTVIWLPTPDGDNYASGLNQLGQVAGKTGVAGGDSGFFWDSLDNPGWVLFGSLGGPSSYVGQSGRFPSRRFINESKTVVGSSINRNGFRRATVWDPKKGLQDLNSLVPKGKARDGFNEFREAGAINFHGQIVGWGAYGSSSNGFVLTPQSK